jgi:nitroreductase
MILPEILNRRSQLAFSPRTMEEEKLESLFEAARWAPSSNNMQPWRFVYALHGEPSFERFFDALMDGNKRWAKDAGALVVTLAEMEYDRHGALYINRYAWHDAGLANALLMIQANHLGIMSHPMGGFDPERIRQTLHLPKEFEPVTCIAIGYPGDLATLPDDLLKRQQSVRTRKPREEIVFHSEFR